MKQDLVMIAAPTGFQPGGYISRAYADRTQPTTAAATLEAESNVRGWRIQLSWSCPEPIREIHDETDQFVDAAAIAAPMAADTPWMTMGEPGKAIEGALWRPDRESLVHVHAEGLGTVKRSDAPDSWKAHGEWSGGRWSVVFRLPRWAPLDERSRLAVAIWRGASGDRGGLKSISQGWIRVTT